MSSAWTNIDSALREFRVCVASDRPLLKATATLVALRAHEGTVLARTRRIDAVRSYYIFELHFANDVRVRLCEKGSTIVVYPVVKGVYTFDGAYTLSSAADAMETILAMAATRPRTKQRDAPDVDDPPPEGDWSEGDNMELSV